MHCGICEMCLLGHTTPFSSEPSESISISGGKDAKLLKMVQMQMASAADDLDMSRIWQTFQSFDRGQRGMLSDAQVRRMGNNTRHSEFVF